jgi:positive regulator of sigma E activity
MNHESRRCREVTRSGIVTAVNGPVADIQIVQYSACSSCRVRALCTSSESALRTVQTPNDGTLAPGMSVVLAMDERLGWLGVVVGFVLPLVLVVGTLFLARGHVSREEIAGVIALATLVPYYGAVRALHRYFDRIVRFRITSRRDPVLISEHAPARSFHLVEKEGST